MAYITNCVSANGRDIQNMVDKARKISWKNLLTRVSLDEIREILPDSNPRLKDDWAVSFWKSTYRGKPVVYIDHSAIEYIFEDGKET